MRFMLLGERDVRSVQPTEADRVCIHRFPMMPPQLLAKIKGDLWNIHSDWWAFGSTDKDMAIKQEFAAYEPGLEKDSTVDGPKA